MGVCTVTLRAVHVVGDRKMIEADVALSATYATGGDTLSGTELKLENLLTLVSVPGVNIAGSRLLAFDQVNNKVKAFTALGTEAVNATDQSSITFRVMAIGKGTAAV